MPGQTLTTTPLNQIRGETHSKTLPSLFYLSAVSKPPSPKLESSVVPAIMQASIKEALDNLFKLADDEFGLPKLKNDNFEALEKRLADLKAFQDRLDAFLKEDFPLTVTALRRLRNKQATIHKLPVEILTEILLQCTEWPNRDLEANRQLASVCRQWYDVIVANPLFWPLINVEKSSLTPMVLKRNPANALIVWCWTDYYSDAENFMNTAIEHVGRWSSLTFVSGLTDQIKEQLERPTPKLEELFIRIASDGNPCRRLELADGCPMKNVDLDRVCLPWGSARLMGLTGLRIRHIDALLPSIKELHKILSACPKLTILALARWQDFPGDQHGPDSDMPPAGEFLVFPDLKSLEIDTLPKPYTNYFVNRIKAPNVKSVLIKKVHAEQVSFDPEERSPLLDLLVEPLKAATKLILTYGTGGTYFHIQSDPILAMVDDWAPRKNDPPGVDVQFDLEPAAPNSWWSDITTWLTSNISTPESVTLKLSADSYTSVDPNGNTVPTPQLPVEYIGDHLPFITHLEFGTYYDAGAVLRYLSKPRRDVSGAEEWPCRQLVSFDVRNMQYTSVACRDMLAFAQKRMRAAPQPDEPEKAGQPKKLKKLLLTSDIVEMFSNVEFLRDVECTSG